MCRATTANERDHPGFSYAWLNRIDTADLERFDDTFSGVYLFKTQFRMGVQITPQGGELGVKRRNMGKCA
jgi:hypothetical protein